METAGSYWRCKTGEINLSEYSLILSKGSRTACKAGSKIRPEHGSGKIEKNKRNSVSSNLGHLSENEHIHKGCDKRLNKIPDWSKNSLFICYYKIPLNKHFDKIAVIPYVAKMKI